jgi:hypothetical protein
MQDVTTGIIEAQHDKPKSKHLHCGTWQDVHT